MAKNQNTEMIVPEIFTIGNLEINKATLIAKRDADVKLVIQGVDDTAGYKQALKLRADYRTVRTTLEKYRKDISKPHQDFVRELKKATDELGTEAAIGETYFDEMMTAVDNEKERIRQEKEAQEQARITDRINELIAFGAKYDGENYFLSYAEGIVVSPIEIKTFGIQAWGDTVIDFECAWEKEQERIAAELLVQQQKEIDERLRLEQEENDRLEREAELARQSNELTVKRTKLRLKELKLLGAVEYDGGFRIDKGPQETVFTWTLDFVNTGQVDEWDISVTNAENYNPTKQVNLGVNIGEVVLNTNEYDETMSQQELDNPIASGNPVSNPQQGYVANEAQEEAPELDYSLNDFENLTRASYNGTKKQKETILEAIASYKEAMNKF